MAGPYISPLRSLVKKHWRRDEEEPDDKELLMLTGNVTSVTGRSARNGKWRAVVMTAVAATILGLVPGVGVSPAAAEETPITCNMPVAGSIKVANDLVCTDTDGLVVVADNTIIDLNGHRISCVAPGTGYLGSCQGIAAVGGAVDEEPEDGVNITGRVNVHVIDSKEGGTIDGFDNAIRIERSQDVKIEHLTLTGPPGDVANPRPFSHGVLIRGSTCAGDTQIHIGTGQFSGNEMMNHNQGIAINGSCVSVVHNIVHDNDSNGSVPSNGILLNQASNNVIRGNEVFDNGDPVDPLNQDGGITIRNNSRSNHIVNNEVLSNFGDGISIRMGSAENFIDNNIMLFNGGALAGSEYWDAAGRGAGLLNKWNQNNQCVTQNAEVPPGVCGPDEAPPVML